MPYGPASFDGAIAIHVAMNIHDREGLSAEVARVLRPGAAFGIYDVMQGNAVPRDEKGKDRLDHSGHASEVLRRLDEIGAIKLDVLVSKSGEISSFSAWHSTCGEPWTPSTSCMSARS